MIITCKKCNTEYSIKKSEIGNRGKKVKCSECGYEWFQKIANKNKELLKKDLNKSQNFPEDKSNIENVNYFQPKKLDEKKRSYKFLFFFIFFILILITYFFKENFSFQIKNTILKFVNKEYLIEKGKKNSFNLVFNQIEKEISILNNNQRVIKIFGKISNTSDIEKYRIPKIQASLIDNENNIVKTWLFEAEQNSLEPQESINFTTSYIHENQDISDIKIEFYNIENE